MNLTRLKCVIAESLDPHASSLVTNVARFDIGRGEVHDFVWLPKVQLLASCGVERHINLWQLPIKTPVYQLDAHQASVQQLLYGAGQMFSIDTSKTLVVWDLREMAPIQRLEALKMHQEFPVGRIAFDIRRSAILTLSRKMLLWHMNQRKVPNGHTSPVTACVYNTTFELLVSADDSSVVRVWDPNTGKPIFRFVDAHQNKKGEPVKVSSMCFDHTNRRLVTGAHDGSAKVWNFSTGQCLRELTGFGVGEITSLALMHITPYDFYVGCGWNRKVTFWTDSLGGGESKFAGIDSSTVASQHFEGHKDDILCMASYVLANLLVTASYDGDIIMWATDTGHIRTRLVLPGILGMKGDERPIEAIGLVECGHRMVETAPAGRSNKELVVLVVTAGGDGQIRVWSSDEFAELLLEMQVSPPEVGLVALDLCSKTQVLVIADAHGFIYVFDLQAMIKSGVKSLQPISQPLEPPVQMSHFRAHQASVSCLGYINQRRVIYTGSLDCTICMWSLEGEKMGTFGEPKEWKMSRDVNRYHDKLDEPAFGDQSMSKIQEEKSSTSTSSLPTYGSKTVKKSAKAKKPLSKKISVRGAGGSAGQATPLENSGAASEAQVSQQTSSSDPLGVENSTSSTFFLTQEDGNEVAETAAASEPPLAMDPAVQSVDEFVAAVDAGPSSESEFDDSDAEYEEEIEKKLQEMTDEEKRAVMLKVDIDDIVTKGVAMKERGEKFFESGRREVSAYQKMIVRDLASYTLPDNIVKRLNKANAVTKKGTEAKSKASVSASEMGSSLTMPPSAEDADDTAALSQAIGNIDVNL